MLLERLVVGPYGTNCYVAGDEATKEGMVIDPGADSREIVAQARELGLKIRYIILTHAHVDHIGAVAEVKQSTGAQLWAHADERGSLQGQSSMFGRKSLPVVDKWLKGGDTVLLGNLRFLVLHTPGHSPGGVSLYGEGVVFSGDTLFNYGIGRTDFPTGSFSQLMNSIYTKLMVLPDNTIVYPGHGPDSTIGIERRGNPFLRG